MTGYDNFQTIESPRAVYHNVTKKFKFVKTDPIDTEK